MEKQKVLETEKEELEHSVNSLYSRYRFRMIRMSSLLIAILSLMYLTFSLFFRVYQYDSVDSHYVVEKESLKNDLSGIIKNGGSLELIKHEYENRIHIPLSTKGVRKNLGLYYRENTPLSTVLNDLRVDFVKAHKIEEDSVYFYQLDRIVQENNYFNPFDNLEDVQVRYFENIRYKVGDSYDDVMDDMNQIVKELSTKNQLVSKYLSRSNTSFIISIIALIISCGLSIFQIIQNISNTRDTLSAIKNTNKSN